MTAECRANEAQIYHVYVAAAEAEYRRVSVCSCITMPRNLLSIRLRYRYAPHCHDCLEQ